MSRSRAYLGSEAVHEMLGAEVRPLVGDTWHPACWKVGRPVEQLANNKLTLRAYIPNVSKKLWWTNARQISGQVPREDGDPALPPANLAVCKCPRAAPARKQETSPLAE